MIGMIKICDEFLAHIPGYTKIVNKTIYSPLESVLLGLDNKNIIDNLFGLA
jgi:hypothetical protein